MTKFKSYLISFFLFFAPFVIFFPVAFDKFSLSKLSYLLITSSFLLFYLSSVLKASFIRSYFGFLKSPISLSLLFLASIVLISSTSSFDIISVLVNFIKLFLLANFLALCSSLLNTPNFERRSFYIAVVSAILVVVGIGIMQYFLNFDSSLRIFDIDLIYSIESTLGHKNILSMVLFLSLPILIMFSSEFGYKNRLIFLLILMVGSLFFLQTRTVLIALVFSAVSGLLFLFFARGKLLFKNYKKLFFICAIVVSFVAIIIIFSSQNDTRETLDLKQRISALYNFQEKETISNYTIRERLFLWQNTAKQINLTSIMGKGSGNWRFLFPYSGLEGSRAAQGGILYQRAHNDLLQLFYENGYLGLLAYLAFIISILYTIWRRKSLANWIKFLTICLLSSWLWLSTVDFPNERLMTWVLLLSFLALVQKNSDKESRFVSRNGSLLIGGMSLLLFGFAIFISSLMIGEYYAKKASELRRQNQQELVLEYIDKAIKFNYIIDNTSTPVALYKGEALFELEKYPEAFNTFNEALTKNPAHLTCRNNVALMNLMKQDTLSALYHWEQTLAISPNFEFALINLASIYLKKGNIEKTMFYLQRVNVDNPNPKYNQLLKISMDKYLDRFAAKCIDEISKNYTCGLIGEIEAQKYSIFQSQKYNRSLSEQLLLDAYYIDTISNAKLN